MNTKLIHLKYKDEPKVARGGVPSCQMYDEYLGMLKLYGPQGVVGLKVSYNRF